LSYRYNIVGNIVSLGSSNAEEVKLDYSYDLQNRLASVIDNNLAVGQNTISYEYDGVGNLAMISLANGVKTNYSYNQVNRLVSLTSSKGATPLADYRYTLGATGQRLKVTELNGRTVTYTYDGIYHLLSETISNTSQNSTSQTSGEPNGMVSYRYDGVGNRQARESTLANVSSATAITYDSNDRLTSDKYDNNGNTIEADGRVYSYDSENRIVEVTTAGLKINLVYNGDGERVKKTVNGVSTEYLIDNNNFTGYAQVVEESVSGVVKRQYSYGLDLISARQVADNQVIDNVLNNEVDNAASNSYVTANDRAVSFYGYDGHGSVRYLSDLSGKVTDTYTYDAYGVLISQTGTTPNAYRYAGEQWDEDLGLYYNRARYLDVNRGRFWTQDTFEGDIEDPLSLHKYLYGNGNPVENVDPSGNSSIKELTTAFAIIDILSAVQSTISFLKQPDLFNGAFLVVGLIGLPGIGEGLKALRLSGRLPLLGKIVQALRFPGPPKNAVEKGLFEVMESSGYVTEFTEDALRLINQSRNTPLNKIVEKVYLNRFKNISLIEAKQTLKSGNIADAMKKAAHTLETLEEVAAAGGKSIDKVVDELIIGYETVGSKLGPYKIGDKVDSINGVAVNKLIYRSTGEQVTAHTIKGEIPVYVKQIGPNNK
jgi:RHS repeat-associated protein